jgi:hypothetical protein
MPRTIPHIDSWLFIILSHWAMPVNLSIMKTIHRGGLSARVTKPVAYFVLEVTALHEPDLK